MDDRVRSEAPTQQPGQRRTHEMQLLYGDKAFLVSKFLVLGGDKS